MHLSDQGKLVAGTRERPGPVLPWLGNEGRLKGIKNWLRTHQGIDLDGQVNQERERQGQTQKQVPTVRTDFTASHDGVVLKNSDEQHPQTRQTLRDSHTTKIAVEQQQASYDGAMLEISDEKGTNWGDYY